MSRRGKRIQTAVLVSSAFKAFDCAEYAKGSQPYGWGIFTNLSRSETLDTCPRADTVGRDCEEFPSIKWTSTQKPSDTAREGPLGADDTYEQPKLPT